MNRNEKLEYIKLREEKKFRESGRRLFYYYPDSGPLNRSLYKKHLEFFEAGKHHRERLMLAANRVGKTEGVGGFEIVLHLTGLYPAWWEGRRFDKPIHAWAAGDTSKTVREIIQEKLLGPIDAFGTGLIPRDLIVKTTPKVGVPEAVETIYVRHKNGYLNSVVLKSYDQKRKSFQGTFQDIIWLDEEPPVDIFTECLMRTMDTTGFGSGNGILMLTFTPLMGMSETVLQFLRHGEIENQNGSSKYVVQATWDDAPHLDDKTKKELWNSIPPYQKDARSKGVPQLGSGAIYPVPESQIAVDDFELPKHWPRGFSMDVGWNRTAAGWYAHDRENDVLYKYGEHYVGQAEPAIHAQSILGRGNWIPGVIDPAARGRSQKDGMQLLKIYKDLGLKITPANNAVEAGIYEVWQRLSSGRLKVFKSCQNFFFEFRLYRRDEKGHIVKEYDHAMDETRYFIMSGINKMIVKPSDEKEPFLNYDYSVGGQGWMG